MGKKITIKEFAKMLEERGSLSRSRIDLKNDNVLHECMEYIKTKATRETYPDMVSAQDIKDAKLKYQETYMASGRVKSKMDRYAFTVQSWFYAEIKARFVLPLLDNGNFKYVPTIFTNDIPIELLIKLFKEEFNSMIEFILSDKHEKSIVVRDNIDKFRTLEFIINNNLDGMLRAKREIPPLLIGDAVDSKPVTIFIGRNIYHDTSYYEYLDYTLANISRNLDITYNMLMYNRASIDAGIEHEHVNTIICMIKNANLRILGLRERVLII